MAKCAGCHRARGIHLHFVKRGKQKLGLYYCSRCSEEIPGDPVGEEKPAEGSGT